MKLTECNDLIPIWKPPGERQQQKEQQMVILVHISICKEKTMFCSTLREYGKPLNHQLKQFSDYIQECPNKAA